MQEGTFVRHRTRPEWGLGRVKSSGEYCQIDFEHHGQAKFRVSDIAARLQTVEEGEVPADHALRRSAQIRPRGKTRAVPCQHCETTLTRSVYKKGRTLKSCPHCSTQDGRFHVFYEYPAGFKMAEPPPGVTLVGPASYCSACRQGLQSVGGRRCLEIE
jgi:hypothetical protein